MPKSRILKNEAITYKDLYLTSIETEYICALEIKQEPGEHGNLYLEAVLKGETKENDIHKIGETVTLMYEKNGENTPLFYGVIDKIQVEKDGDSLILKLEAWDASYIMDTEKKLVTYQNLQMTPKQLMNEIMKAYPGADYKIHIPEEAIGQFLVQYEETDWEFLKRFFARYHMALYPDPAFDAVRLQRQSHGIGMNSRLCFPKILRN